MNEAALLQHAVLRTLRRALNEHHLASSPLVVAVSGGRDSVALAGALALLQRRGEVGLLRIAHVHHGQRSASDEEAALVEALGAQLELPVGVIRLDARPGASPAALRQLRYNALVRVAESARADAVVTAHHADDQLETVLGALVRGAGPRGLAGMPPIRSLDGSEVLLARPLLQCTRDEVTACCQAMGLAWCDDPGNLDPATLRGRLRRDVLPVLESLRPAVAGRIAAMSPVQAAAATALGAALPPMPEQGWARASLARLPVAVIMATLHRHAEGLVGADALSTEALLSAAYAVCDAREHERLFELGGGVELLVQAGTVRFRN